MRPATPVGILVLLFLLSGCLKDEAPEAPPPDTRPSLADLANCPYKYPDGAPLDCMADDSGAAAPTPPSQWYCLHAISRTPNGLHVETWTDLNTGLGAAYRWTLPPDARVLIFYTFSSGTKNETGLLKGGSQGFINFPEVENREATIVINFWNYAASGTPTFLATANLESHPTLWRGGPFVIWTFANNGTNYHFKPPSQPPASETMEGKDYTLEVVTRGGDVRSTEVIPTFVEYHSTVMHCGPA